MRQAGCRGQAGRPPWEGAELRQTGRSRCVRAADSRDPQGLVHSCGTGGRLHYAAFHRCTRVLLEPAGSVRLAMRLDAETGQAEDRERSAEASQPALLLLPGKEAGKGKPGRAYRRMLLPRSALWRRLGLCRPGEKRRLRPMRPVSGWAHSSSAPEARPPAVRFDRTWALCSAVLAQGASAGWAVKQAPTELHASLLKRSAKKLV